MTVYVLLLDVQYLGATIQKIAGVFSSEDKAWEAANKINPDAVFAIAAYEVDKT